MLDYSKENVVEKISTRVQEKQRDITDISINNFNVTAEQLGEIEKKYKTYIFPPSVLVEATAYCNIKCVQCANSKLTRKKGSIDIELYKKIVDEIALEDKETNFWLAFYGEPLILKYKLYYMIKYAKDKGLKNVYLNTNGTLLDDEMINLIVESGLDYLIVGIDGFSEEVFEKIRVGAKRNVVYDNVIRLHNKIKNNKSHKPQIQAQFIVMEENKHELEEYKNFWSKKGIYVKIRAQVTWGGKVTEGSNIKNNLNRVACGWAIGTCPITWDGNLVACGVDCNSEYIFGNVLKQSIKDIWNGERQKFVENHIKHNFDKLPNICKECNDWQVVGTIDFDERGNLYQKNYK